ncbi:MAG: penicillin-binding protein 2 [Candidatus Saccharimonadales bacterium]
MIDNQSRLQVIGLIFLALAGVVLLRLGYLQLVRHDYFSVLASQSHSRKFEIAPQRGRIYAYDRGEPVPLAMNRNLKTLYADTRYIFDLDDVVSGLEAALGRDYSEQLTAADGYVRLEREITLEAAQAIEELEISGIGLSDNYRRVYPEGSLASQVMGFVNTDGEGQYGIEEYLDSSLSGTPGLFDIETDSNGVPIATSDNIQRAPQHGSDIYLTIDRNVQAKVESVLAEHVKATSARSAHAVIMDPNSGEVVAMANYPSFDPNKYSEVEDYSRFSNVAATGTFEPGSGFKVFTMAAGLNGGAIDEEETFYDAGAVKVDDAVIRNTEGGGDRTKSMTDIIIESINTGVVYILERLGGGEINTQAKTALHSFFTGNLQLTTRTDIEQPGEPELHMNTPESVGAVNYANMTFGQGIATTMVRMTTSMAAVINGGTMYRPHLVDYEIAPDGTVIDTEPEVVGESVVTDSTTASIRRMMDDSVQKGGGWAITRLIPEHKVGGKTGTSEIPSPDGGYLDGEYIGSFIGFAPVDNPRYIMMVRIDDPHNVTYAGSGGAGPVFADIIDWLVKYAGIPSE